MANKVFIMMIFTAMTVTACKQSGVLSDNPFLQEYNTPFGVPPFEQIKMEHYLPAFEAGIVAQNEEIEAIIHNEASPSFENTIEALEYSGAIVDKVWYVFANAVEIDGTDEMNELSQIMYQKMSQFSDAMMMNQALFLRVKSVYDQRDSLNLNTVQSRLLEETYKSFVRSGANLSAADQTRMKEINERLSQLSLKFENNVRSETNDFMLVIDNKEDLAGLSGSFIASMAEEAKGKGLEGKWIVTLDSPSIWPFLQMSSRRDLREKVYTAYLKRGDRDNENDNKQIVSEQTSLRAEKAALLGYPNFAAYILDENMAKTPEAAMNLLQQIWVPALSVAKKELADIKTRMNKDGVEGEPESWDWSYYAEKVRLDKYNLDENMIRPYFQLENVLQGVFTVANRLYGLEFKPIDSIPLCHPDAVPYEVTEANGEHLGVIYFDFFPRSTKGQGAWMTEYRTQYISSEGEYITPVVSLVLNFTKPSGSEPALLNIDEVSTLFHEFGHGLHGLLSDNRYKSLSGTSVPTDFVELPSQIMENWCMHPEVLKLYAKHYQTGALIPDELVQKIADSRKFNQGFMTTELTAASILDQYYHIRTVHDSAITDVRAFEGNVLSQLGLIRQIPPRYHSTYFKHIFGGGYSARYYSYLWSETLDADAFEAFTEKGIFDQETAASFRKNILEKGGSDEPMTLYKNFRGHEPNIEALLKRRGLL